MCSPLLLDEDCEGYARVRRAKRDRRTDSFRLGMKEKAEESVAGGRDLSDHQYLDRMYRSNKIELKAPHGYPFL